MIKIFEIVTVLLASFLFLFLFFAKEVNAQVVINEIHPGEEWIELFNITTTEVSLNGCKLSMGDDNQNIIYSASDTIPANGFKVSGDFSNWLNNTGDSVSLDCVSISDDSATYTSSVGSSKSYGRSPDGSNTLGILQAATKGSTNSVIGTATASPTATATATPTSTPTSTPTASPTQKPAPTKSPTPKPTKSPTPEPEESKETDVLGLRDSLKTPTPSPTASPEASSGKQIPLVAGLMIGGGSIFVAIPGVWFLRQRKLYNDHTSENTQ